MGVAIGDGEKRNAPGENKVAEHEPPSVCVVRQVVEAAAREVALGHITSVKKSEKWNGGEKERIEPAEEDHEPSLPKRRAPIRIQWINDDVESVDGYDGQSCDGHGAG